jgi:hypothetical protein
MGKITFVVPNKTSKRARTGGIRKRCGHIDKKTSQHCIKPHGHPQGHSYVLAPSHASRAAEPKKNLVVSTATKLDCLQMIEDPIYRKRLLQDLRERKLRPAVECMLWYYAKGKPKEMVEHSGTLSLQQELSALTNDELQQRALDVAKMLAQSKDVVH